MSRRRRLLAAAGGITAALLLPAAPASGASDGPAPGLCRMDTSRGAVPAGFAIDGCIGGGVWLRNTRPIPVLVSTSGDVRSPSFVRAANVTLAADAMWLLHGERKRLLAPGQVVFVPVGTGAATATISNHHNAASTYIVAQALVAVIPAKQLKGGKRANSGAAFIAEITQVFGNYQNCRARARNAFQRVKCGARLKWDVSFAASRLGLTLASRVVSLVVTGIKTWKLTATLNGHLNAISSGSRQIAIAAVTATPNPVAPTPPPQPSVRVLNAGTGQLATSVRVGDTLRCVLEPKPSNVRITWRLYLHPGYTHEPIAGASGETYTLGGEATRAGYTTWVACVWDYTWTYPGGGGGGSASGVTEGIPVTP